MPEKTFKNMFTMSAGVVGWIAIAVGLMSMPGQAQEYPELGPEEELRLAISAGPPSVAQHADVYRMSDDGFERVIEGTNGWACLVVRVASDSRVLAPHCLNPPAVETVLPGLLREGELQAQGMAAEPLEAELRRQFEAGELPLPEGPAYAYMLSSGQHLGELGQYQPHFMLYMPYVTNDAIGGDPTQPQFPFVAPVEDHPLSTVIIVMDAFVDPASVTLPTQ